MEVKNNIPFGYISGKNVHKIIELYYEFNQLKQLYRQGWLRRSSNMTKEKCESVADHVLGMTLLGYFIADEFYPNLDVSKIIKMTLLHEFGEIYGGDLTPLDKGYSTGDKERLERESVIKVLDKLPKGREYIALWEEFEKGETPESKFVKQMDKLEMMLQASVYEHQGFGGLEPFFNYIENMKWNPEIKKIIDEINPLRKK